MKKNRSLIARFTITLLLILFIGQGLGFIVFTLLIRDTLVDSLNEKMIFAIVYQGIFLVVAVPLILVFLNRNLKKSLSDFSAAVSKVGSGDLTVAIQPAEWREMAILTKGLNSLATRLRNTIQKLYHTINNVTAAIKQINLIIGKVTGEIHKQIGATEEAISALEDIDKSQKKILDSTNNLSGFSEENLSSINQIKSTSGEITENTEQLFEASSKAYSTITEMSAAVKAIVISTEELSASTEQTSASVEQISANLKEVETSTKDSVRLAVEVREVASGLGMMSFTDAMDGMRKIEDAVDKSLELVRDLGIKSRDIEKILSVIADVTKQTNLLSVNTAVLAAQAGEYGKGFSVVAGEIKTLADRTASSAKDITNIVKSIQKGIAETIHVTENSKRVVDEGNTLVMKMGDALGSVLNETHKSSEMTKTIQKATEEQVRGIIQIKEAIEMIRGVVEHVTRATLEQEIGSEHLVGVAEKVKEVSELIKKGMQEQHTGIRVISKNLELTNERIRHIAVAASEQGKTGEEILSAADRIKDACNNALTIAQEMAVSFNILYQEADDLKRDIEGFKFE